MSGWGTTFAALTLWMIFQGLLLPVFKTLPTGVSSEKASMMIDIYYLSLLGISVVSGLLIPDFARVIGSILGSFLLGAFVVFEVLSAPNLNDAALNSLNLLITRDGLTMVAVDLTFRALFPLPLAVIFLGGIIGTALEERYLSP